VAAAVSAQPPRPVTVTLLNYKADGTPFWNALHVSPVRDADGVLEYLIGVQLDVTDRSAAGAAGAAAAGVGAGEASGVANGVANGDSSALPPGVCAGQSWRAMRAVRVWEQNDAAGRPPALTPLLVPAAPSPHHTTTNAQPRAGCTCGTAWRT
jgi:hypothetical protein